MPAREATVFSTNSGVRVDLALRLRSLVWKI